jgi:hypothetical protein
MMALLMGLKSISPDQSHVPQGAECGAAREEAGL